MFIDAILIHIPSGTMTTLYKGRVVSIPNFDLSSLYAINPNDGAQIYQGSKGFEPGPFLKFQPGYL